VIPWDYSTRRNQEDEGLGGHRQVSLIIWWSVIGAMLMTLSVRTAGYAYFYRQAS